MAQGSAGTGIPGSSGSAASIRARRAARSSSSHSAEKTHSPACSRPFVSPPRCAQRVRSDRLVDERCEVAPFEELEAGRACVAGRSRVEHEAAAHGRPVAEDDAVAARRHRGRGEAELRPALSDADDPGIVLGRPVVDVQAHAVRDRLELVERDVEAVARWGRHPVRRARRLGEVLGARLPEAPPRRAARLPRARPAGRAPERCERERRARPARRAARLPRRPIPTRASRSPPSRFLAG